MKLRTMEDELSTLFDRFVTEYCNAMDKWVVVVGTARAPVVLLPIECFCGLNANAVKFFVEFSFVSKCFVGPLVPLVKNSACRIFNGWC